MKAAWYEKQGAARDVLIIGKMADPQPSAGEVRIRVAFSGVNPGDVKKREDAFGVGMPYPRVIPHSDGSGTVDEVGEGVSREWVGRRVWCYGAQSYRPFGTAAEYTVVTLRQVVELPKSVPLEQGACLGIPGITAHRAVHVAGSVEGRTVLVQGGAGSVGACAVQLAHRAGARVFATCRAESDKEIASRAGADEVLLADGNLAERIRALAHDGVHHVVEVAFGANIKTDTSVLAQGGSIAIYATNIPMPETPVWLCSAKTPSHLWHPLLPPALTHEISAKGRSRSGNAHDHWFPTSGRGGLGTDKMLPVLRRVHEFPYIGMEPGVRQGLQSGTG